MHVLVGEHCSAPSCDRNGTNDTQYAASSFLMPAVVNEGERHEDSLKVNSVAQITLYATHACGQSSMTPRLRRSSPFGAFMILSSWTMASCLSQKKMHTFFLLFSVCVRLFHHFVASVPLKRSNALHVPCLPLVASPQGGSLRTMLVIVFCHSFVPRRRWYHPSEVC